MTDLDAVLGAFRDATGCDVVVWVREEDGAVRVEGRAPLGGDTRDWVPPDAGVAPAEHDTDRGRVIAVQVPGPRRAAIAVGPSRKDGAPLEEYLGFLLPVVAQNLQSALEVEHAANELAERYEEINLLYTITEILGRSVALAETASTILREVSETVGARRGSILVYDGTRGALDVVAALGAAVSSLPAVSVADECSVSAAVFRDQRGRIVEAGDSACDAEAPYRRGAMLSVPIMWTAPDGGSEPLGVVNLSDRRSDQPFSAGDQKLITAIATQIGTAIQNARLVRASLVQQQMVQEMELAHDLQMKLLPRAEVVAPEAEVAARVVPAESVGGDFYNLFRLGPGRTGVMIGDVSSHGYRAALIMALAMSAAAIHAQANADPGRALAALLASLREELASTEMFISAFYAVIDRGAGTMRYANAGHPHAYHFTAGGARERLPASHPPLGMVDEPPVGRSCRWHAGEDLLLLFTDGVSDARNHEGARLGEQPVLDAVGRHRAERPATILDRVFDEVRAHSGAAALLDDQTLVVLKT